jgi:hypothetical protein
MKQRFSIVFALVALLVMGFSVPSEAQRRGGGRATVVVRGGFYGYYGYYGDPFWYGYPWFYYQYPGPRYPYGYRYAEPDAAVRIEVTPREAEVFVDGYYAGIVDDFDGVFQRLRLPPGQHELTLYREGFRTVHQTVYLSVDSTFRVRYTMERLQAGDVAEPRPTPRQPPPPPDGAAQPGQNPPGPRAPRGPVGRQPPPPPQVQVRPGGGQTSNYGTLAIRVQPGGAAVIIDGERWEGPQGQERLVVELPEGAHHVQIQRDGFETYTNDVTVRRGETTPINVSLRSR